MWVERRIHRQALIISIPALILACSLQSRAQYFQVLAPIPLAPSSCEKGGNLTRSGIQMSNAKRFAQAVQQFGSALALCPEDKNISLDLMQATVDAGGFAKTESAAKAFLAHHPRSEQAQIFLAYSYLMQRKFQFAGETLQKLLAQDDKDPNALELMGLTLFFYRQYVLAETQLRAALAIRPHDEDYLYELGRIYQTQTMFPAAIKIFKELIALDPKYYRAYNNLALCYEFELKTREAGVMFKTAEQVASKVQPTYDWPYANYAQMLLRQGRVDEALQQIEKAAHINPRSARNQWILGKALVQKNDLVAAEKHLKMTIQLDRNFAKAYYLLGRIYERMHEPAKAKREFARFQTLSKKAHVPEKLSQSRALVGSTAIGH